MGLVGAELYRKIPFLKRLPILKKYKPLSGVQVKSGGVSLNGIDYEEKSKEMKVFLFASNNEVNTNNNPNIIHITVSEVTRFIEEYKHILPKRISSWL